MSFAGIERKVSKEEGKKSKKAKTCNRGTTSPRRRNSFAKAKLFAKERESFATKKQKTEEINSLEFAKVKKNPRQGEADLCQGEGGAS